jgi:hypothetical protein
MYAIASDHASEGLPWLDHSHEAADGAVHLSLLKTPKAKEIPEFLHHLGF